MSIRNIIIAVVIGLLLIGGAIWAFSGGEDEQTTPVSTFTPPPVSEDPPMSSDNIDQIMQEMEERGK